MANNNNISIDVKINSGGQQQIDQYSKAFDSLRTAITNLSNPINSLNSDISKLTTSVNQLNSQNDSVIDKIGKVSATSDGLRVVWRGLEQALVLLRGGVVSFEAALTGGLSVVIAFLPQIVEFTKAFFKGKDAISEWAQNFKNLNEVMKTANTAATEQTTKLNILYKSATAVNSTYEEKLKYARLLKAEFPEQFKNMQAEDIANGKAKQTYDNLAKSILASAKAKAALNKMTEETAKLLAADYQIEKIQNANYNEKKKRTDELTKGTLGGYRAGGAKQILEQDKKESDDRAKLAIEEQNKIKGSIQASIDYLMKFVKDADALTTKATVDTGTTVSNNISIKTGNKSSSNKKSNKGKPDNTTSPRFDAELQKQAAIKLMQQAADDFNKQLENEKINYDTELAALKTQQDQKLISQEEYFENWNKLQEKYHTGLGETIKLFNEQDLAKAQKHQKDLVEAGQLKQDKEGIDKAILPAQKFAAEKKLIDDKYNFEIQKAAEAGKDTAEIRERYQIEITEATKKHEQDRKNFQLETAQNISNAAFSILQNNIKSQGDTQIKQLETQKESELSNTSLTATQRKAIEDKYKKKEAEEKVKAFKAEQKASILQAVINGALAITKATSQSGVLAAFVIPGIIATTAIQVATIAAQKVPQYAKGGVHYQSDGKGALLPGYSRTDNTNAYLRSGEAVVVSEAMRDPWARNLVSAINVAYGGRDFSMANPARGYAIGGIFTDGGNSNRYYNQPMNDQKNLANTIAYQMINNFPPVYVDVKDINNQQNILVQTVNRVNL